MNMKLLLPEWVREEMFEAYLADWGDADDMFAYAKSPKVGPAAGWKPHESRAASAEMLRGWLQSPEVWAVEEKASGRVIEKCGFRYEGTLRRASSIFDGSVHDALVYSMLREEYFAAKRAE